MRIAVASKGTELSDCAAKNQSEHDANKKHHACGLALKEEDNPCSAV